MSEPIYNLVFRGEVLEGQHQAVVAKRLAALLKMDPAKAGALFTGKPVVLKRNAPKAVAAKYQAAFKKAGARLRVMPADGAAPQAKQQAAQAAGPKLAAPKQAAPKQAAPKSAAPQATAKKPSLADRLAADAASAPAAAPAPASGGSSAEAANTAVPEGNPNAQATIPAPPADAGEQFTLAAASGDLVREDERPKVKAVVVDVSHLSAAPAESGSLEDVIEQLPPPPAPDTSGISLAEVGSDIGEAKEEVVASVVAPDIDLAEAGADLETIPAPPPPPAPDVYFDVAALGADLDPSDKPPPPPAPDVSHINMVTERASFALPE